MVPPVAVAAMASLGRRRDAAAMMMVVVAFMSMGHRYSCNSVAHCQRCERDERDEQMMTRRTTTFQFD